MTRLLDYAAIAVLGAMAGKGAVLLGSVIVGGTAMTRLKRAAYAVLIAHAAVWFAVQVYLTVDYVQQRSAIVEAAR